METTDLMIDIETLGTGSNAVVVSIAAVFFDRYLAETGLVFERFIDLQSCIDAGLDVDAGTLMWWLKQDDAARGLLLEGQRHRKPLVRVLAEFSGWMKVHAPKDEVCVWGNGPSFDCSIMANLYRKAGNGHVLPWKHWNERCVRTVVDFAGGPSFKKSIPFVGVKHDAVDDCRHQINLVCGGLSRIRGE